MSISSSPRGYSDFEKSGLLNVVDRGETGCKELF